MEKYGFVYIWIYWKVRYMKKRIIPRIVYAIKNLSVIIDFIDKKLREQDDVHEYAESIKAMNARNVRMNGRTLGEEDSKNFQEYARGGATLE